MKKILLLTLTMVVVFALSGCALIPDDVLANMASFTEGIPFVGESLAAKLHTHDYSESKVLAEPDCLAAGRIKYICACGESKVEPYGEPLGHDNKAVFKIEPTCTEGGRAKYDCQRCHTVSSEDLEPLGHSYEKGEPSRFAYCERGCGNYTFTVGDNKYKDVIVYTFVDSDLDEFNVLFDELKAIIDAADAYDPELHAYEEGTPLHEDYLAMEAKYEELYDVLAYVATQCQIAEVEYHLDMDSEEKENNYDHVSEVRTELVSRFYSFSKPIYDSMYRDFYYYGMTEQEIMAFIFDSDAVSNPEYKALTDRNNEIQIAFNNLTKPEEDPEVLTLYAEFVANNKRMAEIMGYENYLEYAYENVYSREYTYQEVSEVVGYVKEHLVDVYCDIYDKYMYLTSSGGFSQADISDYYSQVLYSFFEDEKGNKTVNDYIDLMAFTSNPDKQITFSDEFNNLISDGNLFRGDYEGAYVTYLMDLELPIAYFGPGYDSPSTIVHEFGHYMNEIYNDSEYDQSYDLLEMHSQGNELLYLHFVKDQLTKNALELCESYQMLVMLDTVMAALAVDSFEQAVYTDTYTGTYSSEIMADGTITSDEYDKLYKGILIDFGTDDYQMAEYWRYVTINAPCYYVSYSVSALSVLQLYDMADDEGFDAAKDAYLKLFTYTDVDPEMNTEQILDYAGLLSFTDEELYVQLEEMVAEMVK